MAAREHRHELFDEAFQTELAGLYTQASVGQPPVWPARLALATILQAYTGASDDEVIEACVMDRRWQLVLDCLDAPRAPFAKGTLVGFRARLVAANADRRLIDRTVELYAQYTGRVAAGRLRGALDSSPLWGAGRVEDTINLLGHALRKVVGVLVRQQGRGLTETVLPVVAAPFGVARLAGPSLKAALDLDWDDPDARDQALGLVLAAVDQVQALVVDQDFGQIPQVVAGMATVGQIRDQDVIFFTPDADGGGQGLPVAYRDVLEVLADAGVPLRASQVCQALGTGGEPRHREGMRSKLKRLVGRGWLVEAEPGLFAPAEGVAGALDGAAATP